MVMALPRALLSDQDQQILEEAMPRIRRESPDAAKIIRRVVRAIASGKVAEASPFVSPAEAAKLLDVTPQTVRNWADRGWLPCERTLGRARRIPRASLASAIALSRQRPPVPDLSPEEIARIIGADKASLD
jgi:excisionase family DNA binding protein